MAVGMESYDESQRILVTHAGILVDGKNLVHARTKSFAALDGVPSHFSRFVKIEKL
jgi:hypothetical protein